MSSAKPSPAPFGYEDYAALPNDGRRWELIDGELEANPAPSPRHQTVSRRLQFELSACWKSPAWPSFSTRRLI
jgi:Uma2 family endonuclease